MWIFMNDAMLSVVTNRDDSDSLMVRARVRGDIEKVFPLAEPYQVPRSDYAWRAAVPREKVAEVIARRLLDIDYDNFKDSIDPLDKPRKRAYTSVWVDMARYQDESEGIEDRWPTSYMTTGFTPMRSR